MANPEHLRVLHQGIEVWNTWRRWNGAISPDLTRVDLTGVDLCRADLRRADLTGADLRQVDLHEADLGDAYLGETHLSHGDLAKGNLTRAHFIRADLSGAHLNEANLRYADLRYADLRGADLRQANLSEANLSEANLNGAHLIRADLTRADLRQADLSDADLRYADLRQADLGLAVLIRADLTRADISRVHLYATVFGDTNLTAVVGLENCYHAGPGTLDHRTLARSGSLPLVFLRGCGLNDWEIEATKLYQPGLTPTQIDSIVYRISDLRADPSIQFYSCFISYASRDQAFAERLYADLQNKGVRCWYAPEDMKIGDEFRSRIDTSIHLHDRLLLILSEHSIKSRWVQKEVETAFEKEGKENRLVLFPLRLDDAIIQVDVGWAADIRRQRHIGDFTQWKEPDAYQKVFARLLRDLKATAR